MRTSSQSSSQLRSAAFRSSLACLACRIGKSKCDGMIPGMMAKQESARGADAANIKTEETVPADWPCSRCARLSLECLWKPSQRFGRPPKRRRTSETHDIGDAVTSSSSTSFTIDAAPTEPQNDSGQDMEQWWESDGHDTSVGDLSTAGLTIEQYGDLSQLLDQSLFECGELSMIQTQQQQWQEGVAVLQAPTNQSTATRPPSANYSLLGAIDYGSAAASTSTTAPAAASPADQFALLRERIHGNTDHRTPSLADADTTTHDLCANQGVARFFSGVGRSLPMYASQQDFHERLPACDAQIYPVAALGYALYEGYDGPSCALMRQRASEAVRSAAFLGTLHNSNDVTRVTHHIAALVLSAYLAYSGQDDAVLLHHMRLASSAALRIGLHCIDDGKSCSTGKDDDDKDALRRVWWELWVSDAIMDVVTGGTAVRRLGDVRASVKFPGDMRSSSDDDGVLAKVYSIRIRAVALLIDSVTALKRAPTAATAKRLAAADTVQANVIAEAQQLSVTIARTRSQLCSSAEELNSASLEQVMLFDCLTMLHAGRIHMHRLFWFADLTLNLQSCSFQRATITEAAPDVDKCDTEARRCNFASEMSASVEKIVASSDAILAMMRIDTDKAFRAAHAFAQSGPPLPADGHSIATQSLPIISPHWPVVGCCQIVASYGLAVGLAARDLSGSGAAQEQQSIDGERTVPRQAKQLSTRANDDELRAMESISGIAFAEASLSVLSSVWPIAARYQEQVHACRIAIDSRL